MIEPWIIIHHCTKLRNNLWVQFIMSPESWLNAIILSQNICIRNNGYNFWARDFIGEIINPLCKLFSIWLWNQAWFQLETFKVWWTLSEVCDLPFWDNQRPIKTWLREIQLVKSYGLSYKDSMLIIYSIILDHLSAENEANWVRQMISNTEIHSTLIKHIRQFLK